MPLRKRALAGAAVVAGMTALLAWSTLRSQRAECDVCVTYAGRPNCATASAASPTEAARSAQTTACGVLAAGMNDAIACDRARPDTLRCRTK